MTRGRADCRTADTSLPALPPDAGTTNTERPSPQALPQGRWRRSPRTRAPGAATLTSTLPGPMRPMVACRTYCSATPRAPYRVPQEPRPPSGQSHICPAGAPAGHDEQQNTAAVPEAHVPWKHAYPGLQSHAEWHSHPADSTPRTTTMTTHRRTMTKTTYRSGLVSRCRTRPSSRYTFSRASLPSSNS
jgi:hypothetical protein